MSDIAAAPGALRLFVAEPPLAAHAQFDLPDTAAAHVKVRRLQPGAVLRLFDGIGGVDWPAEVQAITQRAVHVRLAAAPVPAAAAELPLAVALAFCMPANERVDSLVEKATELGASALWPLMSERSVLRLEGPRAERRRAHWQAVAAAASEQCGRAFVPQVHAVQPLQAWLAARRSNEPAPGVMRWLLSTDPTAPDLAGAWPDDAVPVAGSAVFLSGPEGGFSPAEEEAAREAGFAPISLGRRILRADTAPLAALAWVAVTHSHTGSHTGSRSPAHWPADVDPQKTPPDPGPKSGA